MKRSLFRKLLFALLGLALALLFMLPYLYLRSELKQYSALGYMGLAASCAISNMSVLLPSSSTVYVLLASTVLNPFACILAGGLGTALGEQASYLCGRVYAQGGKTQASALTVLQGRIGRWVQRNAFLTVFLFAFMPLPVFDAAGICAGAAGMKWWKYALAAFLGKTVKFALTVACVFFVLPWIGSVLPKNVPVIHEMLEVMNRLLTES